MLHNYLKYKKKIILRSCKDEKHLKRVNTRGIQLANKCMIMAAIAYNLKKMMKFKPARSMAAVMQMTREADHFFTSVFFRFYLSYHFN